MRKKYIYCLYNRCEQKLYTKLLTILYISEFEDNIKMDLREIGFGDVDWIHWAQDRDR
jgi:hypothetical protein